MGYSPCVRRWKPMCRPVNGSPSRRSRCWRPARCAMSASRSRWSSPRRARRRSMPPNVWWSTTGRCPRSPPRRRALHPERRRFPPRCQAMSAWTGAGAMRMRPTQRSQRRRMSFRFASTTTASSPIRWSRAAQSACMTRRKAATRCMSPARISTATATPPHERSVCRPRMCGSSRPMSAVGSAPRISPMPSMHWCCGRRGVSVVR